MDIWPAQGHNGWCPWWGLNQGSLDPVQHSTICANPLQGPADIGFFLVVLYFSLSVKMTQHDWNTVVQGVQPYIKQEFCVSRCCTRIGQSQWCARICLKALLKSLCVLKGNIKDKHQEWFDGFSYLSCRETHFHSSVNVKLQPDQ